MTETFKEFTFEAAHQTPLFSGLHGHSFYVTIYLCGNSDPVYGWSHNLYYIDAMVEEVRGQVDNRYLNDIEGLNAPSLENVARWVWNLFHNQTPGLDRVTVSRGGVGQREGCSYSGRT